MENHNNLIDDFITWGELKEFVNSIPAEYLDKTAHLLYEDNSEGKPLSEPLFIEDDIYNYNGEGDEYGTLEELKMIRDSNDMPFELEACQLATKKGTPFLWVK
mgnify:CR=1 FL=1